MEYVYPELELLGKMHNVVLGPQEVGDTDDPIDPTSQGNLLLGLDD